MDGSALRSLMSVVGLRDVGGGISLSNAGNMPDWEVDACTNNRHKGSVVLHSSRENSITKIGNGAFEVF